MLQLLAGVLPPLMPLLLSPQFEDDDVKILSGVDEGAFAWLTLNYLLGHLSGSEQDTGETGVVGAGAQVSSTAHRCRLS
jgi:Golgi nucleoside diphosphatase